MKIFTVSFVFFGFVMLHYTSGQNAPNFARMNATNTKGAIYLNAIDSKKPKYFTDAHVKAGEDGYLESDQYFWMKSEKNKVTIFLPFYNPLNNKIASYSNSSSNPTMALIDTLLNSLGSTFITVLPSTGITYITETASASRGASTTSKSIIDDQGFVVDVKTKVESKIKTITLKDWVLQMVIQDDYTEALDDSLISMISKIESLALFKISINKKSASVEEHIKASSKALYEAGTLEDYQKAIKVAVEAKVILDTVYAKANRAVGHLIKTIKNPGLKLSQALELYSSNTADGFEFKIKPLMETKKKALDGFDQFLLKNKAFSETYKNKLHVPVLSQIYYQFNEYEFRDKEKDLKVTLSHRKISEGVVSQDSSTLVLTVIDGRPSFVPFMAPGLGYFPSDVTFTSYTLDNDTITQSISTKTVLPALYFNFYSKLGKNWYSILPQIGVGTGKELPMILLGAGIAYGNRFLITAGIPFYWVQKLKHKNPGEHAEEGDLKEALGFRASGKYPLYISVSMRIGKK